MKKPTLYIEFDDTFLYLAHLTHKNDSYFVTNDRLIELKATEIHQGIIFNATHIQTRVKEFITQDKLESPVSIISFPSYALNQAIQKEAYIFQLALSFCNTPIQIHSLISHSLLKKEKVLNNTFSFSETELQSHDNFFTLLTAHSRASKPWRWLILTSFTLVGLSAGLFFIHRHAKETLNTLKRSVTEQEHHKEDLKEKVQAHNLIKQTHKRLTDRLAQLAEITPPNPSSAPHLLATLSAHMGENMWLSKVVIARSEKDPLSDHFSLTAHSSNDKDVSRLCTSLTENKAFSAVHVGAVMGPTIPYKTSTAQPAVTQFKISGNLRLPSSHQ